VARIAFSSDAKRKDPSVWKKKRGFPQVVAYQHQTAARRIPYRRGEHPVEVADKTFAVLLVEM
jgi:hypothetical protein